MKTITKTILAAAMVACTTVTAHASDMPDNVRVLVDEFTRKKCNESNDVTEPSCLIQNGLMDQVVEAGWCYDNPDDKPLKWRQCKTIYAYGMCRTLRMASESEEACERLPKPKEAKVEYKVGPNTVTIGSVTWVLENVNRDISYYKNKGFSTGINSGFLETLMFSDIAPVIKSGKHTGKKVTFILDTYRLNCSSLVGEEIDYEYYDQDGEFLFKEKSVRPPYTFEQRFDLHDAIRTACGFDS